MRKEKQRNWSDYNRKLKRQAKIEVFLSTELLSSWNYDGRRGRGGIIRYRDSVIEMCLLLRECFCMALRQTQGFVQSLLSLMGKDLNAPDYTTLSRRAAKLSVDLLGHIRQLFRDGKAMVLAVDSTGLSVYRRDAWNHEKHGRSDGKWQEKWRKLHICIDTQTGLIHEATYSLANVNDGTQMPILLQDFLEDQVQAVCADMAYDTLQSRKAIYEKNASQLIPPIRKARLSSENRNLRQHKHILKERDDAVQYIRQNTINGDKSLARAQWKKNVGYHARSLVETTMWRIKTHAGTKLTNRTEENRATQARLKCRLVNLLAIA
jgi:hypothetical protein